MGPKVEACLRFVDAGGESVIASLTEVGPAMAGRAGTHIVPDEPTKGGSKRSTAKKPAGKPETKQTGDAPASKKRPQQRRRRSPDADVIDISTRRRAVAE
jgi:hypothetical protein